MKTHARVVVVGGGVVGCSVLYHLTRKGWTDVVLCERTELTAGATWRAAGHVILYTLDDTIGRLNRYGVELYKRLQAETGQDPGFHVCGNLRLATHRNRLDEFRRYADIASSLGVRAEVLGPSEIGDLWPLCRREGVLAALYNPDDGHIAPSDLTQALAAGARQAGAEIYRNTEVTGLEQLPGGEWRVRTSRGDILCEHVVSATGIFAKQTLDLVGVPAHSVPVRHQYMITEPVPELVARRAQGLPELPVMRDPEESFYVRQQGTSLVIGAYEARGKALFADGVPAGFGQELLPDNLDELLPYLERACERVPVLGEVGIRDIMNGAMPYTPDDMPTTGPAPGYRNLWLAEGNPFGITLAGGIGWQLAEWIVEGEPSINMWPCDARRYGRWATRRYCVVKTEEAYEHTYLLPKPEEELPAGRPLRTSPIHDLLAARGAVFGAVAGWERPNWYAPAGTEAVDQCSFHRPNYFDQVGAECRGVQAGAGLADASAGARFRLSGSGSRAMLEALLCTRLPATVGALATAYALADNGGVRSEFTLWRESEHTWRLTSAAAAESYDHDLLLKALPGDGSVRLENLSGCEGALVLTGPQADRILAAASGAALDPDAFPRASGREITVGLARVCAWRHGDAAAPHWTLHTASCTLRHVFLALTEAGTAHGLVLFGARAANALRLESGTPGWGSELNRAHSPLEAGLAEVIDLQRGGFRGHRALLRQGAPRRRLVRLELLGCSNTVARGNEPIRLAGGAIVGQVTSGGYGHCSGRTLALGYVDCDALAGDSDYEVMVLGDWYRARRIGDAGRSRTDPAGATE